MIECVNVVMVTKVPGASSPPKRAVLCRVETTARALGNTADSSAYVFQGTQAPGVNTRLTNVLLILVNMVRNNGFYPFVSEVIF